MAVEVSVLLPNWLQQRARLTPHRPALIFGDVRWTFAELERRAHAAAGALDELGIQRGDRVGILMRNGSDYVVLVHALMRLGAVLVPLNTRLTARELAWQLEDAGARALIHDSENAELAGGMQQSPPISISSTLLVEVHSGEIGAADYELPDLTDLAEHHSIVYTSGTTGRPKGAMLTYGNHWWNAVGSVLNLGLREDDCWLVCLPLFHVGGLAILFRSVIYGIPAVVQTTFEPRDVNRAIDQGATVVSLVPTMLQRVLDARGQQGFPETLRCVLLGGGSAPRSLLEACARRRVPVVQTYGLTETASQVATLAPQDALRKLGSAGKPLFPMELRIEGGSPSPGEVGEIAVRGPSVTAGYYGRPDATELALRDGWLHTGDLGYLDDEGYLYVVDRRDDLIITGGENVYPAEVEDVLLAHPAVQEAGVTGLPDEEWGQIVVAAVELKEGEHVSAEALLDFCRERLARYKAPIRLKVVDALPHNAAGKLMRSAVPELF